MGPLMKSRLLQFVEQAIQLVGELSLVTFLSSQDGSEGMDFLAVTAVVSNPS
jgi:hypothetical protein